MTEEKEFQARVQKLGSMVGELERISDPAVRGVARDLVQLLLELNATAMEKIMEIVSREDSGHIIDRLGADPLVSSLLVLYGLHPLSLETRVGEAIAKVLPQIRKQGGDLELQGLENGMVRLLLKAAPGCGSTPGNVRRLVEDALYEAAPDMNGLEITGLDQAHAPGFVPLGALATPSAGAR